MKHPGPQSSSDTPRGIRIGAVNYLNTKPLVRGLQALAPGCSVSYELPSRLADLLAEGELDVALVPTAELALHPEWLVVSDACIACRGPVLSVKLLFRVPPAEVKTLALDEGSRTSRILAQVLLYDIHGIRPELSSLPIGHGAEATDADAVLLIGDRAIRQADAPFVETWDLGDRWCRWTERPFVFAVWAARPGVPLESLGPRLTASRDLGLDQIEEITEEQSEGMRLPGTLVRHYLRRNLHFTLGPHERDALQRFYRLAADMGLLPETKAPVIHGCTV